MPFLGYHHAQVSIPPGGEAAARRFYGTVLGLPEVPLPKSVAGRALLWFAVGDRTLHVAVEAGVARRTKAHLAYEVDDIADCRRRLLADGRELVEQPKLEGYDRFHVLDPFGNRLELIGRVTTAASRDIQPVNRLDDGGKRSTIARV
jgi:catechol 2,3-dioxygenase-like lactoylglutathione lyase family enzyme